MGRHIGDFSLEQLQAYKPELVNKPADFASFWKGEKERVKRSGFSVDVKWIDYPLASVEVAELTLHSWDRTPIKGTLMRLKRLLEGPVKLQFHGYTGSRGLPSEFLKWVLQGITVIAFDVRGQGDSPDYANYPNGSRITGWMTLGIFERETYYYTNVYRDIIAQLEWVLTGAPVKPTILGVNGASQGGGLALVAAGLEVKVQFVACDWPFLTHFDRALEVSLSGPYMELINYLKLHNPENNLKSKILDTLAYVDALHFCPDIQVPILMGIGLEDSTTPPSSAYAAFNHIRSQDKTIVPYPQYQHEPNPFHEEKKIAFIHERIYGS
ncbi:acetylxylan esterase [Bacillus sp. B-jedd]|uniref:acetylxylan esterase n=1 Tax=Bacillus sp. B-jedd TaxID=1476857 RepID=UPI0005156543|nr:alpha/beta fold hydrolase [Bacillus sp. B-jedd]CEG28584.1 S-deacylase [Bacillus sp. B-jedd]